MSKFFRADIARLVLCAMTLFATVGMSSDRAVAAPKYEILYSFCQNDPQTCQDGEYPVSGLVEDAKRNIYGGVATGGSLGSGGIYMVTPQGEQTIIYSFCSLPRCKDGQYPRDLIIDQNGNIYGTASSNGTHQQGVVFKLSPKKKNTWKFAVLYDFCANQNCTDGAEPEAGLTYVGREKGLPYDGVSPLYGATAVGGTNNGGVIFKITFAAGKKKAQYQTIYDFCSQAGCTDGTQPRRTLTTDPKGDIFGVAVNGAAADGSGVVFELSPNGDTYQETVLHTFCSEADCTDGSNPMGVITDANGTLFGVAGNGGTGGDAGLIFKIVPNGTSSQETVLYNFCTQNNCSDGGFPSTGVVIAPNGDLYGTTSYWGGEAFQGSGLVYRLHGTKESVVHPFCAEQTCPDGSSPIGKMMLDGRGVLFGTTEIGGSGGGGVLFRVTKP